MNRIEAVSAFILAAGCALPFGAATVRAEGLPAGYEQLLFIGSTGKEYIKTGFVPNGRVVKVCAKYRFTKTGDDVRGFGYCNADGTRGTFFGLTSDDSRQNFSVATSDAPTAMGWSDAATHQFILNDPEEGTVLDGDVVSSTVKGKADDGELEYYLFACNKNGTPSYAQMRLYAFKIYVKDDSGTLKLERDFVPCRKTDGTLGLYDLAEGVFYANQGAGAFEAPISAETFASDFMQVESIQNEYFAEVSSGGSFVSTGVVPAHRVPKIELTYRLVSSPVINISSYVFGGLDYVSTTTSENTGTLIGYEPNESTMRFNVGNTSVTGKGVLDTQKHTVSMNGTEGLLFDGEVVDATFKDIKDNGTVYYPLFARAFRNGADGKEHLETQVYQTYQVFALKIWMDGELERDFVPCVRRSDKEPGFYDRVEGEFYTKLGAGNAKLYYSVKGDGSDICKLDYLESTGYELIRTGVKAKDIIPKVEVKFQYTPEQCEKARKGTKCYIFGYYNGNQATAIGHEIQGGSINERYRVYSTGSWVENPTTIDGNWHTVVLNGENGTTVDGECPDADAEKVKSLKDSSCAAYYIFARRYYIQSNYINGYSVSGDKGCVRIKSFKIWSNGILMRDYIPAMRKWDGEFGLYDKVTGVFYGNVSTETTNPFVRVYSAKAVQRLLYAESTGSQGQTSDASYVNTGIAPNGRVPIVTIDYQMMNTTDNRYVFGYWDGTSGSNAKTTDIGQYKGGGSSTKIYLKVNGQFGLTTYSPDTNRHVVVMNSPEGSFIDGVRVDSESNPLNGLVDSGTLTYYLFARHNGGNQKPTCVNSRIYSFKLEFLGETEPALDLVPVSLRTDAATVGLWDQRTGKFYTSANSSYSLVAGPPKVQGLCIIYR